MAIFSSRRTIRGNPGILTWSRGAFFSSPEDLYPFKNQQASMLNPRKSQEVKKSPIDTLKRSPKEISIDQPPTKNVATRCRPFQFGTLPVLRFICYSPSQKIFPCDFTRMIFDRRSAPCAFGTETLS